MTTLGTFSATTIDGLDLDLAAYDGEVLLIVNTASQCGFTPQYQGLQKLQDEYAEQGFEVLGFPCDQFGGQEPGEDAEIAGFCERNFGVTFPLFSKVDVNGDQAHPVFQWLRSEKGGLMGNKIKWNFTKFLVGRDGRVIGRYAPTTKPEKIAADIEKALAVQMTRFSAETRAEAVVGASRADIWAALTDPDLVGEMTPFVRSIKADGDRWRWKLSGLKVLGVGIAPSFTELMSYDEPERIEFRHDPPSGANEKAGVSGWYELSEVADGTRLVTSLEITLDLPLPRASGRAVKAAMNGVIAQMGERFSKNLLAHLGAEEVA